MLLSVIIPVYNTEKYLEACLDSVLGQTCGDIEAIVINDGSTDGSASILSRYEERYPGKIRAVHQDNRGIGAVRNRGIIEARGKYIAFIDSDDRIDVKYCEALCRKAEEGSLDMAVCDYYEVDEKTGEKAYVKVAQFEPTDLNKEPRLLFDINTSPWNKIYRTDMLRERQICFPENVKYEDVGFTLKAIASAARIGKVDLPLVYYLIREGSETKVMDRKVYDIFSVLDDIRQFFGAGQMSEELREYVEWFCINRLMVYNIQQRYQKSAEDADRFIEESFSYLERHFPEWRRNRQYMKKDGILKRILKNNRFIMKSYVKIARRDK